MKYRSPNLGLEVIPDDTMDRSWSYLARGYSAERVAQLFNLRLAVVRLMKASLK